MENTLYYGDNLDVLRRYIKDESIDLIYLDPPFNSNQDYNVLFAEQNGSRSHAQIKAFEDTWHWDIVAEKAYEEIVEKGPDRVSKAMQAFRQLLGSNDMMAYLAMMAPRLVELWRVLKPSGSIYLHCDPTASHYLKMLMDAVFGPDNFANEIIWHYGGWTHQRMTRFPRKHDVLLFYSKSEGRTYHPISIPWTREEYVAIRKQAIHADESGREYIFDPRGGRGQRRYLDTALSEGRPVDSAWDIRPLTSSTKERLGYPTQKPEALLERIIKASSNDGDIILDPFCGCGTTISVAQRLNRRWIGIDITHLAISLIKNRLLSAFGEMVEYRVIGEPVSLPDAKVLADQDPYQFQFWALGLVGARPSEQKKGADKGIDGRLYFHDEKEGKTKQMIFSVKSGHTTVSHVRDLRGVIERENAEIGVLITLQEFTKQMKTEASQAGFYQSPWDTSKYPRLQIITIAELLDGKKIECPPHLGNVTFKKAPRSQKTKREQLELT
jgi:site-specific DNA-methyltransferase (adenine-specific)